MDVRSRGLEMVEITFAVPYAVLECVARSTWELDEHGGTKVIALISKLSDEPLSSGKVMSKNFRDHIRSVDTVESVS